MKLIVVIVAMAALLGAAPAQAHLAYKPKGPGLEARLKSQTLNLAHAEFVLHHGAREHKRWAMKAVGWLSRERNETKEAMAPKIEVGSVTYWMNKQIYAAERIGQGGDAGGTDPWPNCPDPYDHAGHSWFDTVGCENQGNWLDSPGFYRCGLQFDPSWETVYGRLCP